MFLRTGCYATILPRDIMVISINAMHFSVRNRPENDPDSPSIIFSWLEQKLAEAKYKELKVFLTYHIPHGVFDTPIGLEIFWVSKYEATFKSILIKYTDIISGIFTGHIHLTCHNVSFYQIESKREYFAGVLVNRAVSPIYNNNPGFALYYYIDTMDNPKYYEEYTFNLADTYNKTDPPEVFWTHLYNSYIDLQINELSSKEIFQLLESVMSNLTKYLKYMVLKLGIELNKYKDVNKIVKNVCKDNTEDNATYTMCVDSLNEHIKDTYH